MPCLESKDFLELASSNAFFVLCVFLCRPTWAFPCYTSLHSVLKANRACFQKRRAQRWNVSPANAAWNYPRLSITWLVMVIYQFRLLTQLSFLCSRGKYTAQERVRNVCALSVSVFMCVGWVEGRNWQGFPVSHYANTLIYYLWFYIRAKCAWACIV